MFLIVNEGKASEGGLIARISRANNTIGRDGDVLLNGLANRVQCDLFTDKSGNWTIRNITSGMVRLKGNVLPEGSSARVVDGDELRITPYKIVFRDAANDGPVAQRLREQLYKLESKIHNDVLDRVRHGEQGTAIQQRTRMENELENQFRGIQLAADLEKYLALQSLTNRMIDRIHGYGAKGRVRSEKQDAFAAHVEPILQQVETLICLADDDDPVKRAERAEVLVPWAMNNRPDLIPPKLRREMAMGLLRDQMNDLMFEYGPITDLLKANDVNDIMVLPTGHIFIDRQGMQDSGRKMPSPSVSLQIVSRIVEEQGRRIDQTQPYVDARIKDGSRLNAIIEPLSVKGPALTIRKFAEQRWTLAKLVGNGTLTEAASRFLIGCIKARKSIVISGGTGSGKTTLLNSMAAFIPESERIVTVEDTAEMQLPQIHVVTLQSRPSNLEGKGEVKIKDLVRNSLRMRPDRILVGECRGPETLDMLQAMNTGHDGSMTTIHANSPWAAMGRLEVMTIDPEASSLPSKALREQIVTALDLVVQISRIPNPDIKSPADPKAIRRVISICEVVGIEEDGDGGIILEEIYRYRRRKRGQGGVSRLYFTGSVPTFFDQVLESLQEVAGGNAEQKTRWAMECLQ